jgi:hypothetical protein
METNGIDVLGVVLMAGVSLPLSFFLARACLRGVVRVVTGGGERQLR